MICSDIELICLLNRTSLCGILNFSTLNKYFDSKMLIFIIFNLTRASRLNGHSTESNTDISGCQTPYSREQLAW